MKSFAQTFQCVAASLPADMRVREESKSNYTHRGRHLVYSNHLSIPRLGTCSQYAGLHATSLGYIGLLMPGNSRMQTLYYDSGSNRMLMFFCRIELLTYAVIHCTPDLIDSILSAKLLLQTQVELNNLSLLLLLYI